jgi:hypothetical protein
MLTTFSQLDCHIYISPDINDLTLAGDGHNTPVKRGHANWLLQIIK